MVLTLLAGHQLDEQAVVAPTELVVRGSTAAPRPGRPSATAG
jgi:DNA-binding LacI/PurR family transcriptional regulator